LTSPVEGRRDRARAGFSILSGRKARLFQHVGTRVQLVRQREVGQKAQSGERPPSLSAAALDPEGTEPLGGGASGFSLNREIARELRCVAFKRESFDLCRKAQLMALAAGFERFADRIDRTDERAAAD
jgi:hypothetical protein